MFRWSSKNFKKATCPEYLTCKRPFCPFEHDLHKARYQIGSRARKPSSSAISNTEEPESVNVCDDFTISDSKQIHLSDFEMSNKRKKKSVNTEPSKSQKLTKSDWPKVQLKLSSKCISSSKIPLNLRQKSLDLYYNEYLRIYNKMGTEKADVLARRDALKQEQYIYESQPENFYRNEASRVLLRLRKRAETIDTEFIGLLIDEYERKTKEIELRSKQRKVLYLMPHN